MKDPPLAPLRTPSSRMLCMQPSLITAGALLGGGGRDQGATGASATGDHRTTSQAVNTCDDTELNTCRGEYASVQR